MAIKRALAMASMVMIVSAGAVAATHTSVGLSSSLLGRGTLDRADLAALVRDLGPMHRMAQADVAVVRATLAAGGTTDWHGHPGPSMVVVTVGTIRVVEPGPAGTCVTNEYGVGEAFFHGQGAHNFDNPSAAVAAEFLVTYFAPAGPLLVHEADPGTC